MVDNYSERGALRHLDLGRQVAAAALLDEGPHRYLDPKRAASSSLVIAFGRLCLSRVLVLDFLLSLQVGQAHSGFDWATILTEDCGDQHPSHLPEAARWRLR